MNRIRFYFYNLSFEFKELKKNRLHLKYLCIQWGPTLVNLKVTTREILGPKRSETHALVGTYRCYFFILYIFSLDFTIFSRLGFILILKDSTEVPSTFIIYTTRHSLYFFSYILIYFSTFSSCFNLILYFAYPHWWFFFFFSISLCYAIIVWLFFHFITILFHF